MRTNVTSNTINIIFNFLLIEGRFGFPRLEIHGAAIATVLGSVVAAIMSIISISKPTCFVSIPFIIKNKIRPTVEAISSILKVGYSVFFEQILMRIGFLATALMAADQGADAMAAHQVGMNILGLSFSFGDGLQAAAVALIGRSLGEGKPDKAKEYGRACRFIGACISVVLAVVYLFGAGTLMRLFFDEPHIVDIGVSIMYVAIIITLFQIRQVVYMGCLRGAGDTLYTAAVSAISVTMIRTVVSYVFGFIVGWGIIGIWLGILADQLTRFMLSALRFKAGKWVMIKV
jgi:putative MATE family efflux protein